jgi:hypothetical protein
MQLLIVNETGSGSEILPRIRIRKCKNFCLPDLNPPSCQLDEIIKLFLKSGILSRVLYILRGLPLKIEFYSSLEVFNQIRYRL